MAPPLPVGVDVLDLEDEFSRSWLFSRLLPLPLLPLLLDSPLDKPTPVVELATAAITLFIVSPTVNGRDEPVTLVTLECPSDKL